VPRLEFVTPAFAFVDKICRVLRFSRQGIFYLVKNSPRIRYLK